MHQLKGKMEYKPVILISSKSKIAIWDFNIIFFNIFIDLSKMAQITPEQVEKQWAIKVAELETREELNDITNIRSNKVFYESLAYAILIPGFCVLLSSGFTLIPQHDVFDQPEYWYEVCFPWTSLMAAVVILQALRINVV